MLLHETNSPFNQEQVNLLNQLLPTLTDSQRTWLSGYLAAVITSASQAAAVGQLPQAVPSAAQVVEGADEVTILFGSQTGNCERLAKEMASKLEAQQFKVTVSSMRDFKPNSLKKLHNLLIVVSTHGEGDPPDNAMSFYEFLHSKRAPKLDSLNYSVLALGDTSYEFFCQTGKDFDKRLEELGGNRIVDRVDCDLDFDEPAAEWMEGVLAKLNERRSGAQANAAAPQAAVVSGAAPQTEYSRKNPFHAEVIENVNLNGRGSDLETRHLVLSIEDSNMQFEPGDCIGIYPENHPQLVEDLIQHMKWNADEQVIVNKQGDKQSLREALTKSFEITVLTKRLLEQAAPFTENKKLHELLQNDEELKAYINGRDLLDLVQDFGPWNADAAEFVQILRKLPARLYSIASSYKANPDEVTLVLRVVRYESHGRQRYGVCTVQCAERLEPGDKIPIYVQHNPNFKMPADPDVPIIMVGPGTGVAPFRSFMEEREEIGAQGKSWLFYGDRRFLTDFLYQVDWQRWLKEGVLTRMDVAFSRDTDQKVYVQHRMKENSKELFAWLEEGAYFYICGDKERMAKDVEETLLQIIEQEGGYSRAEAQAYLDDMKAANRYQRDVY